MKKTKKFSKKLLSIIVCIALLMSYLPTMMASAAETDVYNKVADVSTMDGWKNYFDLNNLDTSNAGGVWTDKSVFTDTADFPDSVKMIDEEKNFLTALSAIAANKEIVGYSTVPTDTVLILDVSGSMNQDEEDLVIATNDAIRRLLSVNKNNRVGVVLYSADNQPGVSTYAESVTRLLPLGRYTATNNNFLTASSNTVSVGNTTRLEGSNTRPTGSKGVVGGTYIQAGLWEAWEMFNAVADDDIYISENNWQQDKYRMPIVVLMSDGAPSTGTTNFANVKASNSNVGNGDATGVTVGQGFLVQLTASYVKNRIENKYKVKTENGAGRSLFYTLGFNLGANDSVANSVLNPDATTATDSLWNTYNSAGNTMLVNVKSTNANRNTTTNVSISKNSYATSKSYVDEYFPAESNRLTEVFGTLIYEQIEPHKKAQSNQWWKEKVRQTLQCNPEHFDHVGRGLWCIRRTA